jgi:hypothetical protein
LNCDCHVFAFLFYLDRIAGFVGKFLPFGHSYTTPTTLLNVVGYITSDILENSHRRFFERP